MADPSDVRIAQLLARVREGDDAAHKELMPLLYADLHDRAVAIMRSERREVTLQPTALVHEAWMRLQRSPGSNWEDRREFMRLAGRVMRNVLVDRARRRRSTAEEVDVEALAIPIGPDASDRIDMLDLQAALERLAARDEELEEIVNMRFFAGLTVQETAAALGKSASSVHRAWEFARTFLLRELRRSEE